MQNFKINEFFFNKYRYNKLSILIELFIRSGLLLENSILNTIAAGRVKSLSLISLGSFFLLKIDRLLLYFRQFYIFISFFFNSLITKVKPYINFVRTIYIFTFFGSIENYYLSQQEEVKKFKELLDDRHILISLPVCFFINIPKTVNYYFLIKFLDKLNITIVYIEPYINYSKARNLFNIFQLQKIKPVFFYFIYKASTINLDVKNLFLNIKRKIGFALNKQINYKYIPYEKQIFISLNEIHTFDDYSIPGNFSSRYSLDFFFFFFFFFF